MDKGLDVNYDIIKEIGRGMRGIVYLVKKNNKYYALKRQKISKDEKIESPFKKIWQEVYSLLLINKLSDDEKIFFSRLYEYKVFNCSLKLTNDYIPHNMIHTIENNNSSDLCMDIIMDYNGNNFYDLYKSNQMSKRDIYCFIIQMINICKIMEKNNLIHGDIHHKNITYVKTTKNININKTTINCNYLYSLIDYGSMQHISFQSTNTALDKFQSTLFAKADIQMFMYNIITNVFHQTSEYSKKIGMYPRRIKIKEIFTLKNKYPKTWNKIKKILDTEHYKKFFEHFEKEKKFYDGGHGTLWLILNDIYSILCAIDKKLYFKILGWNIFVPNLIDKKDIIFMVKNINNYDVIIDYFVNKIKSL